MTDDSEQKSVAVFVIFILHNPVSNFSHFLKSVTNIIVTGQQPLKLAHSPLGYAVGKLILIGLDGQSLGSRHTEINFNKIYFPRKQLKIHYHFLTICL